MQTMSFDEARDIYIADLRHHGHAGLLPMEEHSSLSTGLWHLGNQGGSIATVSVGYRCVIEIAVPLSPHEDDVWVG